MNTNTQPVSQLPAALIDRLPTKLRKKLLMMSTQHQAEFTEAFKKKSKSLKSAYLLLLSFFGPHYGYMRKWGLQWVFWLTGGGFFIWWFIDLIRLPGLIRDYNKAVAKNILRNLTSFH